jgi:hypothetical protein
MVNAKHMATFLLGAAAGAAFLKYKTMSEEEKEEMMEKFKAKAEEFKSQATDTAEKAEGYFEELMSKSGDAMKDMMDSSESFFDDLFKPKDNSDGEEAKA